jgi:hypothetical protein
MFCRAICARTLSHTLHNMAAAPEPSKPVCLDTLHQLSQILGSHTAGPSHRRAAFAAVVNLVLLATGLVWSCAILPANANMVLLDMIRSPWRRPRAVATLSR